MAVGTDGSFIKPGRSGAKTKMKLWRCCVAGITQRTGVLVGQHMSVRAAMGGVTGAAAFHSRRRMLEHKRSIFISMTGATLSLLEATQLHTFIRLVGVVAGHTTHCALGQSMSFVKVKLRKRILVALITDRRSGIHIAEVVGQLCHWQLTMNAVAACAVQAGAPVGVCGGWVFILVAAAANGIHFAWGFIAKGMHTLALGR